MKDVPEVELSPRCDACAALCCVLLPFDAGSAFAFDKPGGVACRNLAGHRCTIHDRLAAEGFAGCLRFDCFGAGQRVVQEVFGGQSWRQDPALLVPMEAAFRAMRRLHEDHALLLAAAKLPLTATEDATRLSLLRRLDAGRPRSAADLAGDGATDMVGGEAAPLTGEVKAFLAALRTRLRPVR